MSEDSRWDSRLLTQMKGSPWEAVPGKPGIPVFVEVKDDGIVVEGHEDEEESGAKVDDEDAEEVRFKGGFDKLHTSRKAIEKYGSIPGCPACIVLERRKHLMNPTGRLGYKSGGQTSTGKWQW